MHFASIYDRLPVEAYTDFPSPPEAPQPEVTNMITAEQDAFETFRKLEISEKVM